MPIPSDSLVCLGKIWRYGRLFIEALIVLVLEQVVIRIVPVRIYGRWFNSVRGQNVAPKILLHRVRMMMELAA
jgi:hypothetical protein